MKKISVVLMALCLALTLGCNHRVEKKSRKATYVVKTAPFNKKLFFTGTIQPLKESAVTSPMDAVVETIHYRYGQSVKKGDVIFTLNSNELQKQYNDTLTEYLQAKDSFTIAKAKFRGTEELWDAGLISKNNFLSEKSSLATARVSLMQAARKLTEMLEKMDDVSAATLSALSIAEFDKVREALAGKHNLIQLKAPGDGVLLYPPKSGDEKAGKLSIGSSIKSGQVLGLVGDLTGVSIEIEVPEMDIDKMHPGMRAKVTGIALGEQVLQGRLVAVNAQASLAQGGNLPSFSAVIEVTPLSESQLSAVKVGMSATIEVAIEKQEKLLVPIAAVRQEKGAAVVQLQQKDGKVQQQKVKTGAAMADKVVILAGLKAGDVVTYD
ncbi:MAG: efflux RND transporter periplasmic adaptor subunit [Tatlockia sp.]|jgi:multidrug efflux pump subunit AcrA (membrane-fusion protein)